MISRFILLILLSICGTFCFAKAPLGPAELWVRWPGGMERCFPVTEADLAFKTAFASGQDVLLYVHGRAAGRKKEPTKSRLGYMKEIGEGHKLAIVMFHWKGAEGDGPLSFPDEAPRAAADDFHRTLLAAKTCAHSRNTSLNLVTHSMGSLVVEAWSQKYAAAHSWRIFDNLVLSAPANQPQDHRTWMAPLRISKRKYVLSNVHDLTLGFATAITRRRKLGRIAGLWSDLDPATTYINLDSAHVGHGYFSPDKCNGSQPINDVYEAFYHGRIPHFPSHAWSTSTWSGATRHRIR
jgi:hypothetical protein